MVSLFLISCFGLCFYVFQLCLIGFPHITVTIGHETVMGRTSFFGSPLEVDTIDFTREYFFQKELLGSEHVSFEIQLGS